MKDSINYIHVNDCHNQIGFTHNWIIEKICNGHWDYWGEGNMLQRRCLNCQRIDFIYFTNGNKRTIINEKLWKGINSRSSSV